ncbi:MAG: hypothetical protein IPP35_12105 [Elusimicrobia bacterium]|nr:hypothetical protein [Elusimicrobiota bacterium]
MNRSFTLSAAVILSVVLGGCVTTSRYKKLDSAKTALQAQADGLAAENARLKEDVQKLNADQEALKAQTADREARYNDLVGQLSSEVAQGQLQVTKYKDMLTVDVAEKIFFASGSAKLKKDGEAVLKKVGVALAQFPDKTIRVVGHTDNVPVAAGSPFASN